MITVHKWLITVLMGLILLAGCQSTSVSVDPEKLVSVSGLPLPENWVLVPKQYDGPGMEPNVENWVSFWGQAGEAHSLTGFHLRVAPYSSAARARRGVRLQVREYREHGLSRVKPVELFPYDAWADDCIVYQNRENQGMTDVVWRYRNILIEASLQESAKVKVPDISGMFGAVDQHLQSVLIPVSP